jgi:uncharacterized protein
MSESSSTHGADGGSLSLRHLLSTLAVTQHPTTYVFATIAPSSTGIAPSHAPVPFEEIVLFFREPCTAPDDSPSAGQVTLIIPEHVALTHQIPHTYACKMLTCNVHSSLSAVGFMAVLTRKLADAGISVNPVSGYFHDHLFVPVERAERAVEVLEQIRRDAEKEEKPAG